jgi:hypothetical protein
VVAVSSSRDYGCHREAACVISALVGVVGSTVFRERPFYVSFVEDRLERPVFYCVSSHTISSSSKRMFILYKCAVS